MGAKAGYLPFPKGLETTLLHHGQDASQWKSKSIVPPIFTSTIFQVDNPEQPVVGENFVILFLFEYQQKCFFSNIYTVECKTQLDTFWKEC